MKMVGKMSIKNTVRIIVTGGGTGGHVKPLMAVVCQLQKHHCDILYIGSGAEIEKKEAQKHKIGYKKVLCGKYRRYFDVFNFIDIFKNIAALEEGLSRP